MPVLNNFLLVTISDSMLESSSGVELEQEIKLPSRTVILNPYTKNKNFKIFVLTAKGISSYSHPSDEKLIRKKTW